MDFGPRIQRVGIWSSGFGRSGQTVTGGLVEKRNPLEITAHKKFVSFRLKNAVGVLKVGVPNARSGIPTRVAGSKLNISGSCEKSPWPKSLNTLEYAWYGSSAEVHSHDLTP